jgi:hypothetical protein
MARKFIRVGFIVAFFALPLIVSRKQIKEAVDKKSYDITFTVDR